MKNVSLAWCESTKGRKCEEGREVKMGGKRRRFKKLGGEKEKDEK